MGDMTVNARLQEQSYRDFVQRVLNDIRALEMMIEEGWFESGVRRIGAEQELFLVDEGRRPALCAAEVLKTLDDEHFTNELATFNLECNLDPMLFEGRALRSMEEQLVGFVQKARASAASHGADVALMGILPTLRMSDLSLASMTPHPRYELLNSALNAMRGGAYRFNILGLDSLSFEHDNVMVEACNTSFQIHFQVGPDEFAHLYNVAQLVAAPLVAVSAFSPTLLGRRLWHETRIALFEQSVDTRKATGHLRERASRVSFGSDWVRDGGVSELLQEDVMRFRALLGADTSEDSVAKVRAGEIPKLKALRIHTGTVYRWNRPCFGVTDGRPHLRIENRALPSGPTPIDAMANAAFWFGLISGISSEYADVPTRFEFARAKANFYRAAQRGLDAALEWPDGRTWTAQDLVKERLLPMAREGLLHKNIDAGDVERYLGVIEQRVDRKRTGSLWLLTSLDSMGDSGSWSEQMGAITSAAIAREKTGAPVSEWPLATMNECTDWKHSYHRVEQYMTTDLVTVEEDEPVELVARLMDWKKIRHVPVEDGQHHLVGLVSHRELMRTLLERGADARTIPVRDIMKRDIITVRPTSRTLDAMHLMDEHTVACLPVVKEDRLVGIITERDYMFIAKDLMLSQFSDEPEVDPMA
ncbi:MAG: CBS domain-containing protein [Myxococcota bacterium]